MSSERSTESALLRRAGGEAGLRALLRDFYERVFADVMIGFFFRGKDFERLVEKELELVLELLGAEGAYTGRPIDEVHAAHRIMGGQFDRRLQILREAMADHGVPQELRERWIEHNAGLRAEVTADRPGECRPPA